MFFLVATSSNDVKISNMNMSPAALQAMLDDEAAHTKEGNGMGIGRLFALPFRCVILL